MYVFVKLAVSCTVHWDTPEINDTLIKSYMYFEQSLYINDNNIMIRMLVCTCVYLQCLLETLLNVFP